jgi:hypothetical protein
LRNPPPAGFAGDLPGKRGGEFADPHQVKHPRVFTGVAGGFGFEVFAMGFFRKLLVGAIGAISLVSVGSVGVGAQGDTLISFDSMTGVVVSGVNVVNDRGIAAGGAPWVITSGTGTVDHQGNVAVHVTGLIIPPVGFNPIGMFSATVSCITPDGVRNVTTGPFAASAAGDSTINATVALPHPCKSPEVFVGFTKPNGVFVWFAHSNSEE